MMRCLAVVLLCVSWASPATALCLGLRLQNVPSTVTYAGSSGEYSVFDATEYMQTVNFQVTSPITLITCDYFITLTTGASGAAAQRYMVRGAQTLNYNAYTTAAKTAILRDVGTAGAGQVVSGLFPALIGLGQTQNKSFYWTVAPQQVVGADSVRFQDTALTVELYAGLLLGLYQRVDTETITFQSRVESSVDLSLVDSGGAFALADTTQTIDFGNMSTGQSLSYDTLIRSNDGYIVSLQSQNNQTLRHLTLPAQTVPYGMTLGGASVNLTSGGPVPALSSTSLTPATGDRLQTTFTVGAMTGNEAPGNYRDVITVTVSAN